MDAAALTLAVGPEGTELHCRQTGQGPPVLLIHGLLGSAYSWRAQLGPLAAAGFTAVAPDLPGFGASHRDRTGDYSHPAQAAALAGLLQALGLGAAHVVGHSMGAKVALWLALQHPHLVRTLTLVDAAVHFAPGRLVLALPGATALLRWVLHRRWSDEARFRRDLERFYGRSVPIEVADDYWRRYRRPADREALITQLRQSPWPNVTQVLGQVRVPTLVVWGERDKPIPLHHAHRLVAALASVPGGAQLTILAGADHFVPESAPAPFNKFLLDFIGHN